MAADGAPFEIDTDSQLAQALDSVAVVMVCGSGGVGKTSVAAAIAISEAMRGRKVCVLTIDPARRLANAMGLDALDDRERKVKLPTGGARGGELWALMLDPKLAFDRLVAETAPDDAAREKVMNNRVYQQISQSTAGVQEYMALERLYEIDRGGKYDLVVVDTPPTSHARDLLESPHRMLRFIEGRSLRWFLKPSMRMGKIGLKAIGGSGGAIVGLVQKLTGVEMLRDTSEFLEGFEGMYGTIAERIKVVERMFGDDRTGFLVVTSPEREAVDSAIDFWHVLAERDYPFLGSVVNRVEPLPDDVELVDPSDLRAASGINAKLAERVASAQADHIELGIRDRARVQELSAASERAMTRCVPRMARLVTDLDGLLRLTPHLYA